MKNRIVLLLIILAAIGAAVFTDRIAAARSAEKVIHITAKKFEFSPAEITVKRGEPLAIEIKSEDVTHGFSLPDFKIRTEIKAGQTSVVRFTPDRAGQFTFACDVFCGSGHEDMSGTLTVIE